MFLASAFDPVVNFFVHGGIFMGFLVLLSVVSLTIILWRAMALRSGAVLPIAIELAVEHMTSRSSLPRVAATIEAHPSPLGRVLEVVLRHKDWSREENAQAVQIRARHEVMHLETGLVFLEIATGIAPLLGLLGTLSGLVHIFGGLGADPAQVARGISEALNATIAGLAIAVPCLIAFNYFSRKVETMAITMETIASDLIAKCYSSAMSDHPETVVR